MHDADDRWNVVYAIVVLQGLASAVPWNVFVTESEYLALRVHRPPFQNLVADNFENVNNVVSQAGTLLGFLVYVPLQRWMTIGVQVQYPNMLTLAIMLLAAWLTMSTWTSGNAFAAITLLSQGIVGMTTATITGGAYCMAAWLPPAYLQGMSLGIGLAGTVVSAISFLTCWLRPIGSSHVKTVDEAAPEALAYFLLSSIIIAAAIVTYSVFFRHPFVKRHLQPQVIMEWDGPLTARQAVKDLAGCARPAASTLSRSHCADLEQPLLCAHSPAGTKVRFVPPVELTLPQILQRMMGYNIVAVLNQFVTCAAFPGITSSICSQWNHALVAPCHPHTAVGRLSGDLFVPLMFLAFNAGDVCGRLAAGVEPWRSRPPPMSFLISYSVLRGVLLLGLVLCHVVTPSPWQLPLLFRSDLWPLGLTIALGFTNGHGQSLAMMHAPSTLPGGFTRDRCGPILNLAFTVGCMLGSCAAFGIIYRFQSGG